MKNKDFWKNNNKYLKREKEDNLTQKKKNNNSKCINNERLNAVNYANKCAEVSTLSTVSFVCILINNENQKEKKYNDNQNHNIYLIGSRQNIIHDEWQAGRRQELMWKQFFYIYIFIKRES